MAGLYVHVPFCHSKCIYCDFYSEASSTLQDHYIQALQAEWALYAHEFPETFQTLYIGGGTPSSLTDKQLITLRESLPQDITGEQTIEVNPEDVTPSKAQLIKSLGFNRVSMGVQSFHPNELQMLRRIHSVEQIYHAVEHLKRADISNISIDLIFALPYSTMQSWEQSIQQALQLECTHISAYGLTYEEGTPLFKMREQKCLKEVSDELYAQQYTLLVNTLQTAGYHQYELSNFALPNCEAKHNASYWNYTPYLGLGPAAHSFIGSTRYANRRNLRQYIADLQQNKRPVEFRERLSPRQIFNELIMLGLRTQAGISLPFMKTRLGATYVDALVARAQPFLEQGLLEIEPQYHIKLTTNALLRADGIMAALFEDTDK